MNTLPNNIPTKEYENLTESLIQFGEKKGYKLNLKNPVTINDKINWIKLHPTPLKTFCADKISVHEYSKAILGKDICIPILKVYSSAKDIKWNELPKQCVIKCNHGCAYNIIVKDIQALDKNKATEKLNKWMSVDFSTIAGHEMQYHKIPHKIFVEKYMGDISDYKFWCFNGEPKYWVYSLGNNGQNANHLNFYDMNNNLTDLSNEMHPRNPNMIAQIPDNFNEMVEIAKKLSADFDFVRVDLYSINGTIYLGELTFTPTAGWMKFGKDSEYLGSLLNLNTRI